VYCYPNVRTQNYQQYYSQFTEDDRLFNLGFLVHPVDNYDYYSEQTLAAQQFGFVNLTDQYTFDNLPEPMMASHVGILRRNNDKFLVVVCFL
jgi:hypothetical protein